MMKLKTSRGIFPGNFPFIHVADLNIFYLLYFFAWIYGCHKVSGSSYMTVN